MSQLFIDLDVGETVDCDGGRVMVSLEAKSGRKARLKFEADATISIVPPRTRQSKQRDGPMFD
jgi:hypothetical protein